MHYNIDMTNDKTFLNERKQTIEISRLEHQPNFHKPKYVRMTLTKKISRIPQHR